MRRLGLALAILAVLGLAAAAGAKLWLDRALSPVVADANAAQTIDFEVAPGDSFWRIAATLEERGIIRNARVARWFAQSERMGARLKTGEYAISNAQSTPEIFEALTTGRVQTHPVVIPEGFRATEIADRLAAAGLADRDRFMEVVLDPASPARYGVEGPTLEGYLFPDTYRFARGVPEGRIAKAMVDQFLRVYREVVPDPAAFSLSMREHATLASIVEKETGAAHERPLIAAVFLNRMKRRMRL